MKSDVVVDGDTVIITFFGDIDLQYSGDVREILLESLTKGRLILVNLGGVQLIDSSGVASLLEAFQEARKKGKIFALSAISDPVMRVLSLARLETVFNIADNLDDALEKSKDGTFRG